MRHALHGGADAGGVHEGEHGFQALVGLGDHVAHGAVECSARGSGSADAHLVLDGTAGHGVALAQRAVSVDHELRHDEQRNAACPGGASGRRASTMWMMFSARSCSPAEMKILVPVSLKLPSVAVRPWS
jgi:hypothetical protein